MREVGRLHDLVTWYGINFVGTQVTLMVLPKQRNSSQSSPNFLFSELPQFNLRRSIINSLSYDRITVVQFKGPISSELMSNFLYCFFKINIFQRAPAFITSQFTGKKGGMLFLRDRFVFSLILLHNFNLNIQEKDTFRCVS